jgi:hypothetical protein
MDNRLDNLCLVTHSEVYNWYSTSWRTLKTSDQHLTLYWAAIQQLPPEHLHNEVFYEVLSIEMALIYCFLFYL